MKNESPKAGANADAVIMYIALFFAFFMIHLNMKSGLSDDGVFQHVLDNMSLADQIKNLYFNVNGKIIPDTMATIFNTIPFLCFQIINSLVFTFAAFLISYLFCDDGNNRIIAVLVILLFPMSLLMSAGYVATSTNYLWPATALLLIFSVLKKSEGSRLSPVEYTLYIMALLYAGNQEQTVVIGLAVFFLMFWRRKTKTAMPVWILGLTILAVSLCLLLTAPGHMARGNVYSIFRIPNYPQLDLLDKLYLGFATTISHYLSVRCLVFVLFACLLFYSVWNSTKQTIYRMIAAFPLFYILFIEIIKNVSSNLKNYFQYYYAWSYGGVTYPLVDAGNFRDIVTYIPFVMAILLTLSILFSFQFYKKRILLYTIMVLGVASRMVMAFSPTLFGSGSRTHIYLYIAFICICAILANDLYKEHKKGVLFVLFSCAIINTMQSFLAVRA